MRSSLPLLPLLAGCACPAFADLEVTNPDGIAPAGVAEQVEAAVDQFAAWTGRAGVCVAEVRLVPSIEGPDGKRRIGQYDVPDLVEIDYDKATDEIVYHELCHAVDHLAGHVSMDLAAFVDGDRDPGEVFACACESGPRDLSLAAGVEASCGLDLDVERYRWLDTHVWAAAGAADDPPDGTVSVHLDRDRVEGVPLSYGNVVVGGALIYQYDLDWDAVAETWTPIITPFDPFTRQALASLAPPTSTTRATLLPADADPVLISEDGAWRVDGRGGSLTPLPFPSDLPSPSSGAVVGEEAWLVFRGSDDTPGSLARVDLVTGTRKDVPWPAGISSWTAWTLDGGDPDTVTLAGPATTLDDVRGWLRLDPATVTWTFSPNPAGWRPLERVALPDGRELVTWNLYEAGAWDWMSVAVLDPPPTFAWGEEPVRSPSGGAFAGRPGGDGDWWIAQEACTEANLALSLQLLSIQGEPWVWEFPNGWLEESPWWGSHTLARIEVGEGYVR